jgi:hypothetical protein
MRIIASYSLAPRRATWKSRPAHGAPRISRPANEKRAGFPPPVLVVCGLDQKPAVRLMNTERPR